MEVMDYDIPKSVPQLRQKLREEFEKNKHITDIRVIDMLVIKPQCPAPKLVISSGHHDTHHDTLDQDRATQAKSSGPPTTIMGYTMSPGTHVQHTYKDHLAFRQAIAATPWTKTDDALWHRDASEKGYKIGESQIHFRAFYPIVSSKKEPLRPYSTKEPVAMEYWAWFSPPSLISSNREPASQKGCEAQGTPPGPEGP
uniref:(California timema) hypothetical protein n=1 Tax=Timema californicum TaxID=61474 RepID=A0A7R9IZH5_TIMCA|nr:unnamed protein product [Timema californicum]